MKERKIVPAAMWQMAISLSLALVLIFSTALQASHDHPNSVNGGSDQDHSSVFAVEKCAVCDYLANNQGKQIYLSHPQALAPLAGPVTFLFSAYTGTYRSILQGFINKGPPAAVQQAA